MNFIKINEQEAIEILKPYGLITENIRGTIENVKIPAPSCFTNEGKSGVFVEYASKEPGVYRVFVYSDDDEFLDGVVDIYKDKAVVFPAVARHVADKLFRNIKTSWEDECHLVYFDNPTIDVPSMEGLTLGSLDLSLLDLVNDRYTYKGEGSREKIKEEISNRETVCAFLDGKPVCWMLIHSDNSMGAFYTEKEYRGRGIGVIVEKEMMRRLVSKNKIPFGHIVLGNQASINVSNKTGMKFYKENVVWAGINMPDDD